MTGPRSRRRARTGHRVARREGPRLLFGAGVLAVAAILVAVAFTAQRGLPGERHYVVSARFATLDTLGQRGADVRIAGRRVGQTLDARLEDGVPTVDLQLDADVGPLPVDTTARIRPRGLLGAEFVDLRPGRSHRTLPDGGVIAEGRTSHAAQLSDVLDTLDAPHRDAARRVASGLGDGIDGRGGDLQATLRRTTALLDDLRRAVGPTVARAGATAGLVHGAAGFAGAVDPARDDIVRGVDRGERALDGLARSRPSVERTLDVAPGALGDVSDALRRTDPTLRRAERFARSAERFSGPAPRAVRALRAVLVEGRRSMPALGGLVDDARTAVDPTVRLATTLDPALDPLRRLLVDTREPAVTLGRYGCDLRGFAINWRSFLGYGPPHQRGRLGTHTILRLQLGLPAVTLLGSRPDLPGAGADDAPAPCRLGEEP
ncbi:MAG: MlaD family protein [Solirubrobacteraceae bacterium]|nr:MlaD family protein [Solirubrobacteraceae bacterium]